MTALARIRLTRILARILERRGFFAAFALAVMLWVPLSGLAHTGLSQSSPADGAVLAGSPEQLELVFNDEVRLVRLTVAKVGDEDDNRGQGSEIETSFEATASAGERFTVDLPTLPPAGYKVDWTIIGADGHSVNGGFAFQIDPSVAAVDSKTVHASYANHDHHASHVNHADHGSHVIDGAEHAQQGGSSEHSH